MIKGTLLFAIILLSLFFNLHSEAQESQKQTSIDVSTCLSQQQLSELKRESAHGNLYAISKIEMYYGSCAGDRNKELLYAKKRAELGSASDVEDYATLVKIRIGMKQAFPIYLQAAKMGNIRAQQIVAESYRDGLGVEKNKEQALMWFQIGARCYGDGINDMGQLAQFLWVEKPEPLSGPKALAWLNLVKLKIGLYLDEKKLQDAILASLSKEDIAVADKLTDVYADQAGCEKTAKN
jgi:hypothetical protein